MLNLITFTCVVEHPVNATVDDTHLLRSKKNKYSLSFTCASYPHLLPVESLGNVKVSGLPFTKAKKIKIIK